MPDHRTPEEIDADRMFEAGRRSYQLGYDVTDPENAHRPGYARDRDIAEMPMPREQVQAPTPDNPNQATPHPGRPFLQATEFAEVACLRPWAVPNLIPRDGLIVLASAPKAGKTCFATAIARAMATGAEFLSHRLAVRPVLWCSHEETPYERVPLHRGLSKRDPLFVAYLSELPYLDDADLAVVREYDQQNAYVFQAAAKIDAGLVVVDSLHAAVRRGNLSDNCVARRIMGRLRAWSYHYHIPCLVLHHVTKSATRGYYPERFADSAQILAAASGHIFLESFSQEDGSRRIVLHCQGRHPVPPPRIDLVSRGVLHYELIPTQSVQKPPSLRDRILKILEQSQVPQTAETIAAQLVHNVQCVRNVLHQISLETGVDRIPHGKKGYLYSRVNNDDLPSGEPL